MRFVKMQSVGNDYIVLDAFDPSVRESMPGSPDIGAWARAACDRRFGIGADGVLIIEPPRSDAADAHMTIVNADGSMGAMCANGIRAAARLLIERDRISSDGPIRIAIHDRVVPVTIVRTPAGGFAWAEADMGPPQLDLAKIPVDIANLDAPPAPGSPLVRVMGIDLVPVSMGNPHAVVPSADPEGDMRRFGAALESHPAFPHRVNVHFLQVHALDAATLYSWERGVGHTLACGSGACAAIVAANLTGLLGPEASMLTPGGVLRVRWDRSRNHVHLSGAAATVFEGDWPGPGIVYAPPMAVCPAVTLPLPTIRTDRLVLRPMDWPDAPRMREIMSDPQVASGVASAPVPYGPGEEHRAMDRQLRAREAKRAVGFGVEVAETGVLIGSAGLRFDTPSSAEAGYMLEREHWGRGYATEALAALLRYAFDDLRLDRVFAGHFHRNPASGRVLEKCGFARVGEETCPCTATQRREVSITFELTREGYLAQPAR